MKDIARKEMEEDKILLLIPDTKSGQRESVIPRPAGVSVCMCMCLGLRGEEWNPLGNVINDQRSEKEIEYCVR